MLDWVHPRYYIEGDYIRPIPGSPVREYNPFAEEEAPLPVLKDQRPRRLQEDLAGLALTAPQSIDAFVNRGGLLGLIRHVGKLGVLLGSERVAHPTDVLHPTVWHPDAIASARAYLTVGASIEPESVTFTVDV